MRDKLLFAIKMVTMEENSLSQPFVQGRNRGTCMPLLGKKAQFEVVGLLMIVILMSLGVLFVVQFVVLDEPSTIRQSHTDKQFATSFLNSFLETTTEDCNGQQIKALVHDCVKNQPSLRIKCYDNGTQPQPDSCQYVNKTAFIILNKTLIRRNAAFNFYIVDEEYGIYYANISHGLHRCPSSLRIESNRVPLQIDGRIISLYLSLCS